MKHTFSSFYVSLFKKKFVYFVNAKCEKMFYRKKLNVDLHYINIPK